MSHPGITLSGVTRKQIQHLGESAAASLLERHGIKVIARNWRSRFGELDLVARDGTTLIFVEVKARNTDAFVSPALGVDHKKQLRLRRLAEAFIAVERPSFETCRFDVISVVTGARPRIDHLVDAF